MVPAFFQYNDCFIVVETNTPLYVKLNAQFQIALSVVDRIPESVLELSGNDWEKMYACFAELLSLLFGSSDCDIIRDIRY